MRFARLGRRAVLLSIALVVTSHGQGASAARVDRTQPNYGDSGRQPKKHGSDLGTALIIGGIAAVAGAAIVSHAHHQAEEVGDDDLTANGPRLDLAQQEGSLVVHGFVRAGWPIVIDFQPRPGTQTIASVSVKGRKPVLMTLDSASDGRRRVINDARIPDAVGARDGARPGVIIVYSVLPAAPARTGSGASQGAVTYAPLDIYGIGAGPSAVGSVAINQLQFAQKRRVPGVGFATYGYLAESAFDRVVAEVLRFTASGSTIDVVSIRQLGAIAMAVGPFGPGQWDGLDAQRRRQTGVTRLQVRGWKTASDDKSWVGAVSPQAIVIR